MSKFLSWFSLSVVVIIGIMAIVFGCIVFKNCDISSNDNTTILAFIGILATFVVIGNYLQVKYIQKEVGDRLDEFNEKQNDVDKKQNENLEKYILLSDTTQNMLIMTAYREDSRYKIFAIYVILVFCSNEKRDNIYFLNKINEIKKLSEEILKDTIDTEKRHIYPDRIDKIIVLLENFLLIPELMKQTEETISILQEIKRKHAE